MRAPSVIAPFTSEVVEILAAFEQAATALAEIGTGRCPEGVLNAYREHGGAIGGIAESFIHTRREAREMIAEWERHHG